ncbi:FAD-dependent oxidoreductase [Rubrolithibacter danxiaensis]|uniref:FAD-dependent oxidoreductase n=1 Tax=Rubrolithibacter danxiaensis TaxID=3390805 RepID=UPI003BF89CFC
METSNNIIRNHETLTQNTDRDSSTRSIWQEGVPELESSNASNFNPATIYDVLIIGGGITGLTTALLLQKAGKNCILAEAHTLGYGTTGGTTAHINTFLDTSYKTIESNFGKEGSELVAEATQQAIDLIYQLVKEYNINCDFEFLPGYLYAETDDQGSELEKIYESAVQAGVSVRIVSESPVPAPFKKAIIYEGQAKFHPLKYIISLANEFAKLGGIILEHTFIRDLKTEGQFHVAKSDSVSINAGKVVYATHIPPGINLLHFRCAPYRSYAVAFKAGETTFPQALAYDMQQPYHYFRCQLINQQRYMIVGGSDHKTGHGSPGEAFKTLEEYVKTLYPEAYIEYRWSAQFYEPSDGLPYIGKLPGIDEGVYVATGYSGNGITYGSIAGKILTDLILTGESEFEKVFSPGRIKPVAGFQEFVKENANVAYHFIADRFSVRSIQSLQEMLPDSGNVVEHEGKKLAVYKDASGEIHALNPVCSHAKCIVNWNNVEKSWDCPCHGARYGINGEVLNGPASYGLQKIELNKE